MNRVSISFLALLCASLLPASAQTKPPKPVAVASQFSCPDVHAAASCRSFLELYEARDPDFLDGLNKDHVYVCFSPNEDKFLQVWFTGPNWRVQNWEKDELTSSLKQLGHAMVARYQNGVFDEDSLWGIGEWKCPPNSDLAWCRRSTLARFEADSNGRNFGKKFEVDEILFRLSTSYKNLQASQTDYWFTIQRSTGRFTEVFQSGVTQLENTGRCVQWSPRAVHK